MASRAQSVECHLANRMGDFSCFLQLPLELQDKVWELAVPAISRNPGSAFHVRVVRQAKHKDVDGSIDFSNTKDRIHLEHAEAHGSERENAIVVLSILMATCRRSAAVAIRCYAKLRPRAIFPLRRNDRSVLEIDSAADLVILGNGWQKPCLLIRMGSLTRLLLPPPLRYVAVAWPGQEAGGEERFYHFPALNGLLGLWSGHLRALYVVVEPRHLQAAQGPWVDPQLRLWEPRANGNPMILEEFMDAYATDTSERLVFRCGHREYFELPFEDLQRSGGLEKVSQFLESARQQTLPPHSDDPEEQEDYEDDLPPPTRCRVMTWRAVNPHHTSHMAWQGSPAM